MFTISSIKDKSSYVDCFLYNESLFPSFSPGELASLDPSLELLFTPTMSERVDPLVPQLLSISQISRSSSVLSVCNYCYYVRLIFTDYGKFIFVLYIFYRLGLVTFYLICKSDFLEFICDMVGINVYF